MAINTIDGRMGKFNLTNGHFNRGLYIEPLMAINGFPLASITGRFECKITRKHRLCLCFGLRVLESHARIKYVYKQLQHPSTMGYVTKIKLF
jgi:hypothetical protein